MYGNFQRVKISKYFEKNNNQQWLILEYNIDRVLATIKINVEITYVEETSHGFWNMPSKKQTWIQEHRYDKPIANPILNVKIMNYSFGVGSWTVKATIVD